MPYLPIQESFWEHRKTVRLKGYLGDGAEVYMLRLWTACLKQAQNGDLSDFEPALIERSIANCRFFCSRKNIDIANNILIQAKGT